MPSALQVFQLNVCVHLSYLLFPAKHHPHVIGVEFLTVTIYSKYPSYEVPYSHILSKLLRHEISTISQNIR